MRKIVSKVRAITKFLKNSTKGHEFFEAEQAAADCQKVLRVPLDVRTRWNSTYRMLERALELMVPINTFMCFYKSPNGKRQFAALKSKLTAIEEREWAILWGICHLLGKFDSATKLLSAEQQPSFLYALPVLRDIKRRIEDESLFSF